MDNHDANNNNGKAAGFHNGNGGSSSSSSSSNNHASMMHRPHHVRDLDNAFSRMSLYNGGSVFNNNNNNGISSNHVVNYGGGSGGDQLYSNRMLLRSAMNYGADQNLPTLPMTPPFYGSEAASFDQRFMEQNGSSSSSVTLTDHFNRFRSMQRPFPPPPTDNYPQSNPPFYPPPKHSSVFDYQFENEQFPHLERYHRRNGWRNTNRMLVDEFNDQSNISFAAMRGNLVNYAMDQNGCRVLQMMFEKMGREEFDILFEEVICYITQLMMDQYGNFIFQKLVQVCSVAQRTQIVVAITRNPFHLVNICLNSFGTRAVQKLLMYLTTREQKGMIVAAISPGVFDLSKDGNAHHVIVHCIKNFPYELNKVFLDQMVQYCFELSTDQSGCCVVQSCVDHSRGEGRDRLVCEILSVAQLLVEDRFGNYVVQCLLRQMDQVINMRVWEKLKGNFTSLSCNKFGSNVVEACLEQSDRRHVDFIILEMLENPHVSTLFSDPYGNYVIQVALSVSKGAAHEALVREIQKRAPSLQSNQYGKMTLSWFDPKKRRRSMKNKNKYGQYHP